MYCTISVLEGFSNVFLSCKLADVHETLKLGFLAFPACLWNAVSLKGDCDLLELKIQVQRTSFTMTVHSRLAETVGSFLSYLPLFFFPSSSSSYFLLVFLFFLSNKNNHWKCWLKTGGSERILPTWNLIVLSNHLLFLASGAFPEALYHGATPPALYKFYFVAETLSFPGWPPTGILLPQPPRGPWVCGCAPLCPSLERFSRSVWWHLAFHWLLKVCP